MKFRRAAVVLLLVLMAWTEVRASDWVVVPGEEARTRTVRTARGFDSQEFFPDAQGVYAGLIAPTNVLTAERCGDMQLTVYSDGYFSGKFTISGDGFPLEGWFNSAGLAGVSIYRRVWDDCHCYHYLVLIWTVELDLVPGSDEILGKFVNHKEGGWRAELYGLRAGYAKSNISAPQQGRYTLRLPGSVNPAVAPPGDGFGAVTVNARGQVNLSGTLPDGVKISDSAYLSVDGFWPIYIGLHDGHGMVFGWVQFFDGQVSGELAWHKPYDGDRTFYPQGFEGSINAVGGTYLVPASATSPFTWTVGRLEIFDGNITGAPGNAVEFKAPGKLSNLGGDILNLKIKVNAKTGVFNGSFKHPVSGKKTNYGGAMFQFEDAGGGYFLGIDRGGTLRLFGGP